MSSLRYFALIASFILGSYLPNYAQSFTNELKVGIYAKDFKKIYENLNLHLSKDKNNTNPDKWNEIAAMLIEIKDYSSAWQFYLHSSISLFQNNTFSKREKTDRFTELLANIEKLKKLASADDLALIEQSKFSIYPGEDNTIAVLARMLAKSKNSLFSANSLANQSIGNDNFSAAMEIGKDQQDLSTSNTVQVPTLSLNVSDTAPFYDYFELISNLAYPKAAYLEGIEGKVLLELILDDKGDIVESKIIESSNQMFDQNALQTIQKVKFSPALRDGLTVMSKITVPVYFTIK